LAFTALFLLAVPTGLFWSVARPVLHKDIINKYAAVYKFDPLFVMALVQVESSFQKSARSSRGAIGLMQLMPDTAREMAQRLGKDVPVEDLDNPEINIQLGYHYLSLLRAEFKSDNVSILAAYNGGPANVRVWRQGQDLTLDKIPFAETRAFVKKVMSTHRWLKRFQRIKNAFNA
jgi:soluble lytic murein transglycosylase